MEAGPANAQTHCGAADYAVILHALLHPGSLARYGRKRRQHTASQRYFAYDNYYYYYYDDDAAIVV